MLVAALALSACTAGAEEAAEEPTHEVRVIQPGPPGEPSRVLTPEEVAELDLSPPAHTEADITFMQNMIPHHQQALIMTGLVADRTSREDVPLFAERMDISQEDEIELMKRWLAERDAEVPDEHGHHHTAEDDALMPGMLTDDEIAALEAADGEEFDRLFLQYMRRHHEGAVQMVETLFAADGGQEPEIFQFATHIDSDQRIEISRIDMMLAEMDGLDTGIGGVGGDEDDGSDG